MDVWMMAIAVLGLFFTGGGLIAAGVWAVGQIKGSLESHGAKIEGLTVQVKELAGSVQRLDDKHDGLDIRVARIEERISGGAA